MRVFHLTEDGMAKLKAELAELQSRRRALTERLQATKDYGDLAENPEYETVRQESELLNSRIAVVRDILEHVQLIKTGAGSQTVVLGAVISLHLNGREEQFTIVETIEADPLLGKISDKSPLGSALMGKAVGDEVTIKTPVKTLVYKIIAIT